MAGNLEQKARTIAWAALREMPNLDLANGRGQWHVFPRKKKSNRGKIRFINIKIGNTVSRGPPAAITKKINSVIKISLINKFKYAFAIFVIISSLFAADSLQVSGKILDLAN